MIAEKQAIELVEKAYPGYSAEVVADIGGVYYVNIIQNGESDGLADIHTVDKETGKVSGNIPFGKVIEVPGFVDQITNKVKKKDLDDHLEHHGIKGQKWGERNGPPYPLDSETHKEVIKKADSSGSAKKASEGSAKSFISKHSSDPVPNGAVTELGIMLATTTAYFGFLAAMIHIQEKRAKKEKQKFEEASLADNEELSKQHIQDYAELKSFSNENPPKRITGEHSIDDDTKAINPLFDENKDYTATNCVLCSVSYDLRRRGYDVTAKMCRKGSMMDLAFKRIYGDEAKIKFMPSAKDWDNDILDAKKQGLPEGARGMISVGTPYASMRHCMSFEVENGKLRIIDSQCADSNVNLNDKKWQFCAPYLTQITRVDHLKPDMSKVNTACAELKDDWKTKVPKNQKTDGYKQYVEQYKKDHPNTQLSDDEIGKNYNKVEHTMEYVSEYLAHHGVQGQKWGVRRYQNEDGSLTEEGKKRYQKLSDKYDKAFFTKGRVRSEFKIAKTAHDMRKFEDKIDRKKYFENRLGGEENIKEFIKELVQAEKERDKMFFDAVRKAVANKNFGNAVKELHSNRHYQELNEFIDNLSRRYYNNYFYTYDDEYMNAIKKK